MVKKISVDVSQMVKGMKITRERLLQKAEKSLKNCGDALLTWSLELVPIDTGVLRDSGNVWQQGKGFSTIVYVSYNTPYALLVHEDLALRHGAIFNVHYATEIAAGITHERRDQEQAQYLLEPLLAHAGNGDFATIVMTTLMS